MKKLYTLFSLIICLLILSTDLYSQSPDMFNYQAVYRDATGAPVVNTAVDVDIFIHQGSTSGTVVFSESHSVTTTDQGLINIKIGSVATVQSLTDLEWDSGPFFLQVDIEGVELSNTQLLSVPFSMYADKAGNGVTTSQTENWNSAFSWGDHSLAGYSPLTNDWTRDDDTLYYVNGNVGVGTKDPRSTLSVTGTTPNDSAIFEVINNSGQRVFAVYNDGVRITIDETAKGPKGGFAIGGFDGTKGIQEYLRVTSDSTRIYVNQNAKGPKGGFAIGGFDGAKGETFDFVNLTPDNYFIGHESGTSITTGLFNSFFGYNAGMYTTSGSNNIFMGYQSGYSNTIGFYNINIGNGSGFWNVDGDFNTLIGYGSGYYSGYLSTDPSYNTYIGFETGYNSRTGTYNTYIGHRAGKSGDSANGSRNVFIGDSAGVKNTSGDNNIFVGKSAGAHNIIGDYNVVLGSGAGYHNNGHYNVFIGYQSGYNNVSGADSRFSKWNTFIGYQSGYGNTTGWHNIAIGYQAGLNNQSATNQFFIGNSSGENLTDGYGNTFVGHYTGNEATNASQNTILGYFAGRYNQTGASNVYIGYVAGNKALGSSNILVGDYAAYNLTTGDENVIMGRTAGYNLTSGTGNVFLGYRAGYSETSVSDKLYIANELTSNREPLIYGDFATPYVIINGRSLPAAGLEFFVNGQSGGYGAWLNYSDESLKTKINTIPGALGKVMKLRGVNFEWKDQELGGSGTQMGFIAQEAISVVPEVVNGDGDFFSMQYAPVTALLVEAMKEQQKIIEKLEARITELENRK